VLPIAARRCCSRSRPTPCRYRAAARQRAEPCPLAALYSVPSTRHRTRRGAPPPEFRPDSCGSAASTLPAPVNPGPGGPCALPPSRPPGSGDRCLVPRCSPPARARPRPARDSNAAPSWEIRSYEFRVPWRLAAAWWTTRQAARGAVASSTCARQPSDHHRGWATRQRRSMTAELLVRCSVG
jgi:hypothetical protein